jgi:tRNA nucleotidyltransferase (CCA-adding enzyme)
MSAGDQKSDKDRRIKTYLVGGAVRDRALGLEVVDRDWVVVGATVQNMLDKGYQQVGKDFPVFINKKTGEEYALARTERKTAKGYQGFQFDASEDVSLEQDLARRDITINAIAEDDKGELIDPYDGMRDLSNRIIRHVSDAFVEDPVRVLRVARFAARFKFTIANETMVLMRSMVTNGEVDALVPERVWTEMKKALGTDAPQVFFQTLRDCGALARVLPEIDSLFGIPQTAKYHPEIDTGIHTMMVVEQAAKLTPDLQVRFAALVHDLGKATTPKELLPSHKGHEARGLPLIENLCKRLRVPKKYRILALDVSEFHLHMHKMLELRASTVLNMLQKTKCLNDAKKALQIAQCCLADARGRTGLEDRAYPQAELFLEFQRVAATVNGGELSEGLSDGTQIQAAIRKARLSKIRSTQNQWRNRASRNPTHY